MCISCGYHDYPQSVLTSYVKVALPRLWFLAFVIAVNYNSFLEITVIKKGIITGKRLMFKSFNSKYLVRNFDVSVCGFTSVTVAFKFCFRLNRIIRGCDTSRIGLRLPGYRGQIYQVRCNQGRLQNRRQGQ